MDGLLFSGLWRLVVRWLGIGPKAKGDILRVVVVLVEWLAVFKETVTSEDAGLDFGPFGDFFGNEDGFAGSEAFEGIFVFFLVGISSDIVGVFFGGKTEGSMV